MDKITIEELAIFLPYGLEVHVKYKGIQELKGVQTFDKNLHMLTLTAGISVFHHEKPKPIVRPMSKLFKPFQYAGGTVNVGDLIIEEWNKKISLSMIIPLELQKDILQWEYWQILIAAKYHFDIFGWLDKGLAIERT